MQLLQQMQQTLQEHSCKLKIHLDSHPTHKLLKVGRFYFSGGADICINNVYDHNRRWKQMGHNSHRYLHIFMLFRPDSGNSDKIDLKYLKL